jgi:hypothetical protein
MKATWPFKNESFKLNGAAPLCLHGTFGQIKSFQLRIASLFAGVCRA